MLCNRTRLEQTRIMNLEEAQKASRNGAIAACISAALTLGVFLVATMSDADGALGIWNDPTIILDVIIILLCAVGMLRQSRAAALLMVVYWILAKAYIFLETGQISGLLTSLLFLYFFAKAVQGTFAYHRLRKEEDPEYRAAPRWYYYVGIPVFSLFVIAFFFGLLTMTGYVPSTEIVAGTDVSSEDRASLVANGVLFEDEQIEYFYSYGLLSVLEGGNVLTDRAVVTYFVGDDGELTVYELTFDQIESISLYQEGDWVTDALYMIQSYDEDFWFVVELSIERGGDALFIEALREKVSQARSNDSTP